MTYDEYKYVIANSTTGDWIYDDEHQSYLYKPDISITMKARVEDDVEFHENWVENFIKQKACRHVIEFYYNGERIADFYTVYVDEKRMFIPYPKAADKLIITREQYNIGRIINIPHCQVIDNYDSYLNTAGIVVE